MALKTRQTEKDVEKEIPARTLQPKPGMWSKVVEGAFLTTDPTVVDRLFARNIKASCRRGTEVIYAYPAAQTAEIQDVLKQTEET